MINNSILSTMTDKTATVADFIIHHTLYLGLGAQICIKMAITRTRKDTPVIPI